VRRASQADVRLAVDVAVDHVRDLHVSIDGPDWLDRVVDHICEMHGIDDETDRLIVLNGVSLAFERRELRRVAA
jgi:hypothetical protein